MLRPVLLISKYMWVVFYSFLKFLSFFYSEVFSLRSRVSKQWLGYQWWYVYHSLRNYGLFRIKHSRALVFFFFNKFFALAVGNLEPRVILFAGPSGRAV